MTKRRLSGGILVGAALLASGVTRAAAQATPDAKAGSVIVETQKRKPKVDAAASKGPDPAIVVVGGGGRPVVSTPKQAATPVPKAPTKAVTTP